MLQSTVLPRKLLRKIEFKMTAKTLKNPKHLMTFPWPTAKTKQLTNIRGKTVLALRS
jgi:hypothetical protein